MGFRDGQDLSEPVSGVQEGDAPFDGLDDLMYLAMFDLDRITDIKFESDMMSPRFRQPTEYTSVTETRDDESDADPLFHVPTNSYAITNPVNVCQPLKDVLREETIDGTPLGDVMFGETPEHSQASIDEARAFAAGIDSDTPHVALPASVEAQVETASKPYTAAAFFHFKATGSLKRHHAYHAAYNSDTFSVEFEADYETGDLTITVREEDCKSEFENA